MIGGLLLALPCASALAAGPFSRAIVAAEGTALSATAAPSSHAVQPASDMPSASAAAAQDDGGAPSSGCRQRTLNATSPVVLSREVSGLSRRFVLVAPELSVPLPLILLGPGSTDMPNRTLQVTEMQPLAVERGFAVAVLSGLEGFLNVDEDSQPLLAGADDVAYTLAVLEEVDRRLCIDWSRVFCTGYSRGGRFCSMLASKLPGTFAAIAPVAGVRFPHPNTATPLPILAFHGTGDPVNLWKGNGIFPYWNESVPETIGSWTAWNGCQQVSTQQVSASVSVERHTSCSEGADVALYKIEGGGHTWPGNNFEDDFVKLGLGTTTHEIAATPLILDFFSSRSGRASAPSRFQDSQEPWAVDAYEAFPEEAFQAELQAAQEGAAASDGESQVVAALAAQSAPLA